MFKMVIHFTLKLFCDLIKKKKLWFKSYSRFQNVRYPMVCIICVKFFFFFDKYQFKKPIVFTIDG